MKSSTSFTKELWKARRLATGAGSWPSIRRTHFINGQGAYNYGVPGFEIGVLRKGPDAYFYVFANEGARIWIQSPLENERFIYGEAVHLSAFLTSEQATDVSALSWTSNSGGLLGRGADVTVAQLSISTDTITVTGYGIQATRLMRVFADLVNLYRASPAPDEIARIDGDFSLQQIDSGKDEQWNAYPAVFDQQSTDPQSWLFMPSSTYYVINALQSHCHLLLGKRFMNISISL